MNYKPESTENQQLNNCEAATFDGEVTVDQNGIELFNIPLQPFQIYRLNFDTRCQSSGYWYADFYNEAEEQNYADNYSCVYESPEEYIPQSALFMARAEAVNGRIGFRAIDDTLNLRNVNVCPVTKPEALQWMDTLYESLPKIDEAPEHRLLEHLPQTREKLKNGGTLRIVALGDSISNDMMNGLGHLLIERQYSNLTILPIHANGPEKSTINYQQDEVLQRLVIRHKPDLFTVGGASHEPESIRNVIRKVRAACNNVETIYFDIRVDGDPEQQKRLSEFETLCRMGDEDGFKVYDMTTPFEKCISRAEQPAEWFRRDAQHVNDRGKQILGRLYASCLT